jgi:hypothetical protein
MAKNMCEKYVFPKDSITLTRFSYLLVYMCMRNTYKYVHRAWIQETTLEILRKYGMKVWNGSLVGYCEHSSEPFPKTAGNFVASEWVLAFQGKACCSKELFNYHILVKMKCTPPHICNFHRDSGYGFWVEYLVWPSVYYGWIGNVVL